MVHLSGFLLTEQPISGRSPFYSVLLGGFFDGLPLEIFDRVLAAAGERADMVSHMAGPSAAMMG
jgi:hypothetical protein